MTIDPNKLRQAFGSFLTGVTVVSAIDENGNPVGFTANSFTSVSVDPPLLLVCPAISLSSYAIFQNCKNFSVNILSENQREVANIFASPHEDRFGQVSWHEKLPGCPVIDDVSAYFCCSTFERMDAGDHLILVGKVDDYDFYGSAGLGFSNTGFFSLGLERRAGENPKDNRAAMVGAVTEFDGKLLVAESPEGLIFPISTMDGHSGPIGELRNYMGQHNLSANIGPVYSIFDNRADGSRSTYYRCTATNGNIPDGLIYIPIDEIGARKFASTALKDMCDRYISERRNGVFGLYIGDNEMGDVHVRVNEEQS